MLVSLNWLKSYRYICSAVLLSRKTFPVAYLVFHCFARHVCLEILFDEKSMIKLKVFLVALET